MDMYDSLALALGGFIIVFLLLFVAWLIFYIIGTWKLFEKAGKPGWAAIIPYYHDWVFTTEMAGLKWWWFIAVIASSIGSIIGLSDIAFFSTILYLVSLVGSFAVAYNVCAKIGKPKDIGYAIVLALFGFVMYPIMGFSKKVVWDPAVPVEENAIFEQYINPSKKAPAAPEAPEAPKAPEAEAKPEEVNPEPAEEKPAEEDK